MTVSHRYVLYIFGLFICSHRQQPLILFSDFQLMSLVRVPLNQVIQIFFHTLLISFAAYRQHSVDIFLLFYYINNKIVFLLLRFDVKDQIIFSIAVTSFSYLHEFEFCWQRTSLNDNNSKHMLSMKSLFFFIRTFFGELIWKFIYILHGIRWCPALLWLKISTSTSCAHRTSISVSVSISYIVAAWSYKCLYILESMLFSYESSFEKLIWDNVYISYKYPWRYLCWELFREMIDRWLEKDNFWLSDPCNSNFSCWASIRLTTSGLATQNSITNHYSFHFNEILQHTPMFILSIEGMNSRLSKVTFTLSKATITVGCVDYFIFMAVCCFFSWRIKLQFSPLFLFIYLNYTKYWGY